MSFLIMCLSYYLIYIYIYTLVSRTGRDDVPIVIPPMFVINSSIVIIVGRHPWFFHAWVFHIKFVSLLSIYFHNISLPNWFTT